jgi:hypothetical protein
MPLGLSAKVAAIRLLNGSSSVTPPGQLSDPGHEGRERIRRLLGGEFGIKLGQRPGVAQRHHRLGNLIKAVLLTHQPRDERHPASDTVDLLIGLVG